MSRVEPIKIIENPLSGVPSGEEDELGEGINEARIPLLRHSLKRHSTPSTNLDDRRGPVGANISSGSSNEVQPGRSTSSSQIISYATGSPGGGYNEALPVGKSGVNVGGSCATSSNIMNSGNILATTSVIGKGLTSATDIPGISQSQSLQGLGNPPIKTTAGKFGHVNTGNIRTDLGNMSV